MKLQIQLQLQLQLQIQLKLQPNLQPQLQQPQLQLQLPLQLQLKQQPRLQLASVPLQPIALALQGQSKRLQLQPALSEQLLRPRQPYLLL